MRILNQADSWSNSVYGKISSYVRIALNSEAGTLSIQGVIAEGRVSFPLRLRPTEVGDVNLIISCKYLGRYGQLGNIAIIGVTKSEELL